MLDKPGEGTTHVRSGASISTASRWFIVPRLLGGFASGASHSQGLMKVIARRTGHSVPNALPSSEMGKHAEHPTADAFSRALVYVVAELGQVGVTKLEKILYLGDLEHFRRAGRTITGAKWLRYKLGPMAKRLPHVRDALVGYE